MRTSVRAIIVQDDKFLLMKRDRGGHQFYTLVGGGVDPGETPEQALHREVREESGISIANPRLIVVMEHDGFGTQHIYQCDYVGGTPALAVDSEEATQTASGENTYQPLWLPTDELQQIELLPIQLRSVILSILRDGSPATPIGLKIAD